MKKDDQRKHKRLASLNLSYVCLDEDRKAVKQGMGRTLNVSESGVLLETHFPIQPGHSVILSIGLKDDLVDIKGRLIHSRSKKGGLYEVGIEFVEPGEDARRVVRNFIEASKKN
jgi:hypothetical protein